MDLDKIINSLEEYKKKIDNMTQEEMASLWRYAPAGHPYFDTTSPLSEYFIKKFKEKGGMTPRISKEIGWDKR